MRLETACGQENLKRCEVNPYPTNKGQWGGGHALKRGAPLQQLRFTPREGR